MNFELFLARRIHFNKQKEQHLSRPAVRIAIIGIALGVAVMLLSVAIVIGFKQEIRNKVIAFGSHIQIANYDSNQTYETKPIATSDTLMRELASIPGVRHIQRFATKPGIIKTNNEVQGIILKGIDKNFDWEFYKPNLVAGDTITLTSEESASKQALISLYLSKILKLKVGDSFLTYFVQNDNIRARKFSVVGIYCTNFEEYDKQFILTDIKQIQQLNNWTENQASGIEVLVTDYNKLDDTADRIYYRTANRIQQDGSALLPRTIEDINPQVFSWLRMLDVNVWIILTLMLIVAGFNMISGLLILILERTNMIGILKALGSRNWSIRKIFLYQATFLIGKGLLWGNILGLGLMFIQYTTHILPLDAATYYISYVPIQINIWHILIINIGTFVISVLMLIIPSYIITKISPAQSMRFD